MKFGTLVTSREALASFARQKMPLSQSYKVSKIIKKIDEELKWFYDERMKLFEELGEKQENGDIKIPKEKTEEFTRRLNELAEVEANGLEFVPLKLDEFNMVSISPEELGLIDYLFEKEQ